MDRNAAVIDGTDRRTDGRTPDRYVDPAPIEAERIIIIIIIIISL